MCLIQTSEWRYSAMCYVYDINNGTASMCRVTVLRDGMVMMVVCRAVSYFSFLLMSLGTVAK